MSRLAAFLPHVDKNRLVGSAAKAFLPDRLDITAGLLKEMNGARTEVLIQFESHAALLPGKSTKRSRVISAP